MNWHLGPRPEPSAIDWSPDGVEVTYHIDREWWELARKLRGLGWFEVGV